MTLKETREYLFSQMKELKAGNVSIDEVLVDVKATNAIVSLFQIELNAVSLAAELGKPVKTYQSAVKQIEGL